MIKHLAVTAFAACSIVVVVVPSRAATSKTDSKQPVACLPNGAVCNGSGCCSHNCVQSKCVP